MVMQNQQGKKYLLTLILILAISNVLYDINYAFMTLTDEEAAMSQEMPDEDFRFVTVEKVMGFFKSDLAIYEEMGETSRTVGTGVQGGSCYILKQVGEWLYIESGEVRGFVQSVDITQEEESKKQIQGSSVAEDGRISLILDIDEEGNIVGNYFDASHDMTLSLANPTLTPIENKGFAYTKTTTQQVLIEKQYLIAKNEVSITEDKDNEARVIGVLSEGGLAFSILKEEEWLYVESGNVRGFARAENFHDQEEFFKGNKPEEEYLLAQQKIKPLENKSLYYTITSTKAGDSIGVTRESMVTHAQQIEESEAIKSGDGYEFMQSIYAEYGYSIPTTREELSNMGKVIPIDQVRPGDLVFWTYNGTISEPAMHVGSEKMLIFSKADKKVSISDMKTSGSIWAIDFLSPQREEYLGEFKLTAYCKCTKCVGVWSEGPTASGVMPVEGRTVAMWGVPFGTSLLINGDVYVVEDRGTPYGHIDIYMEDHDRCINFGVQYADVSKLW